MLTGDDNGDSGCRGSGRSAAPPSCRSCPACSPLRGEDDGVLGGVSRWTKRRQRRLLEFQSSGAAATSTSSLLQRLQIEEKGQVRKGES